MLYATAVRHLRTIAEACTRLNAVLEDGILIAVHAHGRVLDAPGAELPFVDMVFVLALPAGELPWGVEPPGYGGLVHLLRLDKLPVARCWRSASVPVQNRFIRRPVRIWTSEGAEVETLAALAAGQAEQFRLPAPDPVEEAAIHDRELALSLSHLRSLRDCYWQDREWRREHSRDGRRPEDHLWDAVNGYVELSDAAQ